MYIFKMLKCRYSLHLQQTYLHVGNTGSLSKTSLSNETPPSIRSHGAVRGKAVAVKIFTKSNRSDFEVLKKSALCEVDLMFKLMGMY